MAKDNIEVYATIDLDEFEKGIKKMEKMTEDLIKKIQNKGNIKFKINNEYLEIQTKKTTSNIKSSVEKLNKDLEKNNIEPKINLKNFKKSFLESEIYARDTKVKIDNKLLFDLKLKSVIFDEKLKKIKEDLKRATSKEEKIILSLESKNTRSELTEINRQIKNLENTGDVSISRLQMKFDGLGGSIGNIINKIKAFGIGLLSLDRIKNIFGNIIGAGSKLEQVEISFSTMLGSTEKAKKLLNELTTFAKNTPFDIPGIRETTTQLLAFGFIQDEIIPSLKMLGDVAAGTGKPISQIAYAYGQVKTAGQLYGTELMQFTNAGVPLLAELARMHGVTEAEMKKMVSSGKIGFKEVEQAFKNMTGEGGIFFNLMENQSNSLSGKWNMLKEDVYALAEKIGNALIPILKSGIDIIYKVIDVCKQWSALLISLTIVVGGLIGHKALMGLLSIVTKLAPAIRNLAVAKGILTVASGSLSIAILGLMKSAIIAAAPFIVLAGAIWKAIEAMNAYKGLQQARKEAELSEQRRKDNPQFNLNKRVNKINELENIKDKINKNGGSKEEIKVIDKEIALEKEKMAWLLELKKKDGLMDKDLQKKSHILGKKSKLLNLEKNQLEEQKKIEQEKKILQNYGNGKHLDGINTLEGYNNHLSKLQEEIKTVEIGTEKYALLQKGILETQNKIAQAEGRNQAKSSGGAKQKIDDTKMEEEIIKARYKTELEKIDKLAISEEEKTKRKKKIFEKIQKEIDKIKKDSFELEKEQNEELGKLQEEVYNDNKRHIDEGKNIAQRYYDSLIDNAKKYKDELDNIYEKQKSINDKMEEATKSRNEKLADRYVKIDNELEKIKQEKENIIKEGGISETGTLKYLEERNTLSGLEYLKNNKNDKIYGELTGEKLLKLKEILKQEEKLKKEQDSLINGKKTKYNKNGSLLKGTDIADAGRRVKMTDSEKIFDSYNKEMEKLEKEMIEAKEQEQEKRKLYDETIKMKENAEKIFTTFIKSQTTERIGEMEKMKIKAMEIAEEMARLGFTGQGFKADFIKKNADGTIMKETQIINYNNINTTMNQVGKELGIRDIDRYGKKISDNINRGTSSLTSKK